VIHSWGRGPFIGVDFLIRLPPQLRGSPVSGTDR
jgi:hypothetical protein